jgi:Holliday junction resolvase RusA-like endonuclease
MTMHPIKIEIPGSVTAKARPRATRTGTIYTPARTASYEAVVRDLAARAMDGRAPFDVPLDVAITVYRPIPASWSRRRQAAALAGDLHPGSRPDLDNLAKAICDGLNGIAYRDDALICGLSLRKRYGDRERAEVTIAPTLASAAA